MPPLPDGSQDVDQPLNTTPTYTVTHVFSTADVTGTFDGLTQGDVLPGDTPVVDFTATPMVTQEGVNLYPINSEFGYLVTDFIGAEPKDFVLNPEYAEGWVGDLTDGEGTQLGLVISDSPTDSFKTPARLGTWLAGLGDEAVKASTEHYVVMQNILSDQKYPGDPDALYPLDDDLYVIGGTYDGMRVQDAILVAGDVNGDGAVDIKDVLAPNETQITENIAVGSDYSITLKDDGKLLYRWGNMIKKPNDVRIEAELPLPDEWKQADPEQDDLIPLFKITRAELVTVHTITNNPNDQIRPEDLENESATGTLPTYEILPDGKWVTTDDYYAGDGTLYPAGTVLKDPALAEAWANSTLGQIGATDGAAGFTNAWYTTMNREPFEPVIDGEDYTVGPRWRLKADKYGQDLPSVTIPTDPSLPPPPTQDEVKYDVGANTQTVINLLDWKGVSPLQISAGWQNNAGTVSVNGLNMTDNFDVAFYIKGDVKPATLYSTQLVLSYEEVAIAAAGAAADGTTGNDVLAGRGGNTFTGLGGEDMFVLSYGADDLDALLASVVNDFQVGVDALSLIDLGVTALNFDGYIDQVVTGGNLQISLLGRALATLVGVTQELTITDFRLVNRDPSASLIDAIIGTDGPDSLTGDADVNEIQGLAGNDTLLGLGGNDTLYGGDDNDSLVGGSGDDQLHGGAGDDILTGMLGDDLLDGGDGFDTADYSGAVAVTVNLANLAAQATGYGMDVLRDIERVLGGTLNDSLTGNGLDNALKGGTGNDSLSGLGGDDILTGGFGNDVIDGGTGVDHAIYVGTGAITVDLALAGPQATGQGTDTLISIEQVTTADGNDRVAGNILANWLSTGLGNDTVKGAQGNDLLLAGGGNDKLYGGSGDDQLSGGAGADQFYFGTGGGSDTVTDFQNGVDVVAIGLGADSFAGLTITDSGADAIITFADVSIKLLNVDHTLIDSGDFLFV